MSDEFKIIYRILKSLKDMMDLETANLDEISFERYKITETKYNKIIEMLYENEYIQGITIKEYIDGAKIIDLGKIEITLKGLEYLEENSLMQKAKNVLLNATNMVGNIK